MKLIGLTLTLASISLAAFGQVPAATPAPRLLCLYLDLSSLGPADLAAGQDQAIAFVEKQAAPADQVAVMTYTSQFAVLQDFTNDHGKLVAALRAIMPGQAAAANGPSARLQAIQAAAAALGSLPGKKTMIYFSTGVPVTGQPDLRSTIDALIQANISIYPVDARGAR